MTHMDAFTYRPTTPPPVRQYKLSPEKRQRRRELYARNRERIREQQRRYRAEGKMK